VDSPLGKSTLDLELFKKTFLNPETFDLAAIKEQA
jgi:hypothetical protein